MVIRLLHFAVRAPLSVKVLLEAARRRREFRVVVVVDARPEIEGTKMREFRVVVVVDARPEIEKTKMSSAWWWWWTLGQR